MAAKTRWLERAGWAYVAVGVTLAALSFVPEALRVVEALAVPGAGPVDVTSRVYAAITGGLTAGMGAMLVAVARALDRGPAAIVRGLGIGLTVWYVIDTAGSLAHGAWPNALSNTLFFALGMAAVVPIARTR